MITARQVKLHTLAAEANLARAQRRWAKLTPEQVAATAEADVLAALIGPMTDLAIAEHGMRPIGPSLLAAGDSESMGLVPRIRAGVLSAIRTAAASIASSIQAGRSSISTIARTMAATARGAGATAYSDEANGLGYSVTRTWHVSPTCSHSECLALDGRDPGPGIVPPLHKNCGCSVTVERLASSSRVASLSAAAPIVDTVNMWRAVLVIEGEWTSDGRMIDPGGLTWRTLPLPLTRGATDDHEDDVVVGQILTIERVGNELHGTGNYDTSPDGVEARRLVDTQMLRWVSIVHDMPTSWEIVEIDGDNGLEVQCLIHSAAIAKATIVDHPAFAGAVIVPYDSTIPAAGDNGRPAADVIPSDAPAVIAASAAPLRPPASHFARPAFDGPTGMQIVGRHVFGHMAPLGSCHTGMLASCVSFPTGCDFASTYLLRPLTLDDGSDVATGVLCMGAGHAPSGSSIAEVQSWYDGGVGGRSAAWITAGYDDHGAWYSGHLADDMTDADIATLRGLSVSVDLRERHGRWELYGIAAGVLVPGWPLPSGVPALAASGRVIAGQSGGRLVIGAPRAA